MSDESGVDDAEKWASIDTELDGAETLEGELSKELAVLHRVFRHDFRNRLNIILGHAKLAKEHTDDESLEAYLETILSQATELTETVGQVSLVEQIASSEQSPNVVDIASTLKELIAEFDEQTGATFEAHVPGSVWVWLNPSYEEAFRELIENAVVHNDSPDPHVTVQVDRGAMTEVSIADNGPGMPPGTKASLEAAEVNPTDHLTSLGLWTAYWILTRSGATLSIEDNDPRGCRVTISLRSASAPEL